MARMSTEDLIKSRGATYGPALENHECIAARWTATLRRAGILAPGASVSWRQVVLCMIDVKQSRQAFCHKQDNLDDIKGYVRVYELCEEAEAARHPVDVVADTQPPLAEPGCDRCQAPSDHESLSPVDPGFGDHALLLCGTCLEKWEEVKA